MRRLVVTVGLVAVLGLTGCGGGGSKEKAAPTTTPTTATTVAPATTIAVGNDQAATPFCALARTLQPKLDSVLANLSDTAKLRAAATDAESAITQAQTTAPAAIKPDVTVVATTASQVLAALRKNNFDIQKTPEVAKLADPGFQSSFANVNRFTRAHCGVG